MDKKESRFFLLIKDFENMNNEMKYVYRSEHAFNLALRLAFTSEYENDTITITAYRIKDNTLYLFKYASDDNKDCVHFPFKMGLAHAQVFVWGWLQSVKPVEDEPDTDGSVHQGFEITTDGTDWRGGSGFYGSFIAIKPRWIVYGK